MYARTRAYARENECVHARNDVGEMTTAGRKNSAGGAPPSKDYPIIKKNDNFPPPSFFLLYRFSYLRDSFSYLRDSFFYL